MLPLTDAAAVTPNCVKLLKQNKIGISTV